MATNISLAIIGGRLTKNPEIKQTASGTAVCPFTIAVNSYYKEEQHTEYCDCVAYGNTAEKIGKFFTVGKEILVFCRSWTTKTWKTKDGTERNTVEYTVNDFCFVGINANDPAQQVKSTESKPTDNIAALTDGDLPF